MEVGVAYLAQAAISMTEKLRPQALTLSGYNSKNWISSTVGFSNHGYSTWTVVVSCIMDLPTPSAVTPIVP